MDPGDGREERSHLEGWLFVRGGAVPEKWRDRAIAVSFVPLMPGELEDLVAPEDSQAFVPEQDDVVLYKLIARGLPAPTIATELGIATRSVHRRLARLRDRLGVETTAQLAAEFARRGF